MLAYSIHFPKRNRRRPLSRHGWSPRPIIESKLPTWRLSFGSRPFIPKTFIAEKSISWKLDSQPLRHLRTVAHTTLAKYQIYTEYMPFNPVLQYFAVKMSSFVLNVFSLQAIKLRYQAVEKCASLQPSVQ